MNKITNRLLNISLKKAESAFLWGPRRVGKTYWIKNYFLKPEYKFIDLLKTDTYIEYSSRPYLLRERWDKKFKVTVIDEIQKVPQLLDEIHWLIEDKSASFLLTGSSARKLRRSRSNLLAGRAYRYEMGPLSYYETKNFNLEKALNTGLIPSHFLSKNHLVDLRSYVNDYLKEEIATESYIRSIPAFSKFLKVAAFTNAELLNYTNVARESGISSKVVRNYFEILEDTFLGFRLSPFRKTKNRKVLLTDKFYFFDVGISNYIAKGRPIIGNEAFGKSFEHFVLMELMNYKKYKNPELDINYWKTSSGFEVEFIINSMHTAIEVKSSERVHKNHLKGLKALKEEHKVKNLILVCREKLPRTVGQNIQILPWKVFLQKIWEDRLLEK